MSDFYRDATTPIASKQYVCIACGWLIPKGEKHHHQTGVYDGSAFSNRFHDECWTALAELGAAHDDGFITGYCPVPERCKAEAEAHWEERRRAALAQPSQPAETEERKAIISAEPWLKSAEVQERLEGDK